MDVSQITLQMLLLASLVLQDNITMPIAIFEGKRDLSSVAYRIPALITL